MGKTLMDGCIPKRVFDFVKDSGKGFFFHELCHHVLSFGLWLLFIV